MSDLENAAAAVSKLVGYIRTETGIQLHEEDLSLDADGGRVRAYVWQGLLGEGSVSHEADAADLAMAVMEGAGDVRTRLVELRLAVVRTHLGDVARTVRDYLNAEGWDPSEAAALALDVEEDRAFGAPERGWPRVDVVATHPDRDEVRVEANIHFPEAVVDTSDLTDAILEGMGS